MDWMSDFFGPLIGFFVILFIAIKFNDWSKKNREIERKQKAEKEAILREHYKREAELRRQHFLEEEKRREAETIRHKDGTVTFTGKTAKEEMEKLKGSGRMFIPK